MSRIMLARLVLALVAVLVWALGKIQQNEALRWVGIAILTVAILLRFAPAGGSGDRRR